MTVSFMENLKSKIDFFDLKLNFDITTVTPKKIIENFDKVIDVCESQ